MNPTPPGGYFLPNNFVQLTLLAFEDVTGKNAVKAVLNLSGLSNLIGNFPPGNPEKKFPLDDFSKIFSSFEDLYGPRGGRALSYCAGEQTFLSGKVTFGLDTGGHPSSLAAGLERVAWYLNSACTADASLVKKRAFVEFRIGRCPACFGRWAASPVCHFYAGFLREAGRWAGGGKIFYVKEINCIAEGEEDCVFELSSRAFK